MADQSPESTRRISLELRLSRIAHIDALKKEWGIKNRGEVLERLLDEIFGSLDGVNSLQGTELPSEEGESMSPSSTDPGAGEQQEDGDEQSALVLIGRGSSERLEAAFESGSTRSKRGNAGRRSGGIDLPGFVQRRSSEIRDGFRAQGTTTSPTPPDAPLPQLSRDDVRQAMEMAREHWQGLYGKPPDSTVLEASMVWLATDIWPHSDQSEGRIFTWSGACQLMEELVPGWSQAPPSFERVIGTAGVLEDPFSGSTLTFRVPTLIRRFVQRFRRRRRGTSFQTLEHTMTLQGALKLLELPTDPGERVSLQQVREAYREQARSHHPDSGGSVEMMRRLNEGYQLLKELYQKTT